MPKTGDKLQYLQQLVAVAEFACKVVTCMRICVTDDDTSPRST